MSAEVTHGYLCDAGFGRTAAFGSLRSDRIYTLGPVDTGVNCSKYGGSTRPFDAAHDYSGI